LVTKPELVFRLCNSTYPYRKLAFFITNQSLDAQTVTSITMMTFVE